MLKINISIILVLFISISAYGHSGGQDKNGGHFDRKTNTYHCHSQSCKSQHKASQQAHEQAEKGSFSNLYNRKSWPHWIDVDGDCQNTRHELLIATSETPVKFKKGKICTVQSGQWYGVYTGKTFTLASDLDIDHVVPLAHAHRNGAVNWTRNQKKAFANDPINLLAVDDSTNQSKSDKGPSEWMPPRQGYWCKYAEKWNAVKLKYKLSYSQQEKPFLDNIQSSCQ
jgi:hypothetical protein